MHWVLAGLLVALAAGCRAEIATSPDADAPKIWNVVTTTEMVADIVRAVGGHRVRVIALMGAGVDPHLYKASPGDVRKLIAADLVVYSGLHLEGKLIPVFVSLAQRKPTVAVTDAINPERLLRFEGDHPDPHVWMDPMLWAQGTQVVERALRELDPDGQADYAARGAAYREQLASLDAEFRQQIGSIPPAARILVTAHDAFGYFARAYGMQVRSIQGISTESEASVREVNELVDFLVARRIPAIFVESSVSERNARALLEGCRARGHTVTIGGELFSDAMGPAGTAEGTYAGMLRHNVATIVRALR